MSSHSLWDSASGWIGWLVGCPPLGVEGGGGLAGDGAGGVDEGGAGRGGVGQSGEEGQG